MKRSIIFISIILTYIQSTFSQDNKQPVVDFSLGRLIVSENKRFLIHEDGTPFLYLGDTAWELFHRLNEEEVEMYLENRRAKGFTVIQAVILAELNGLEEASKIGLKPLNNNKPEQPNEAYFQWIDTVIRIACNKGIVVGLLPTWGDKVSKMWGVGPEVFNPENAFEYGAFLGKRYRDTPNIIWINGGDRPVNEKSEAIWDALAKGIKSEDKNHLMTFHPSGEQSSSTWFHDKEWLDFNMSQTGHSQRNYDIFGKLIVGDYNRQPTKPCINGEPCYEDHPVMWKPELMGWFDDTDTRQAMYWSLFSGAFGHTYGCHPLWQFKSTEHNPVGLVRHNWNEVLDLPGAENIKHAKELLKAYDYLSRVPAPEILVNPGSFAADRVIATRGKDYAFVYLPNGYPIGVSLEKIPGAEKLNLLWFDVRTGERSFIKQTPAQGTFLATPQKSGRGNDWVLIMEKSE